MKFSVLMSVYFKEEPEFFDASLKSILVEQTIKPNEMVLVVDGPIPDELNKIIFKYKELYTKILKVYYLEKNGGLGQALKFGLEKCSHELVARADSDDLCYPKRFEKQLKCLHEDENLDICGSSIEEFDDDYLKPKCKRIVPLDHKDIFRFMKFRNPMCHMTVMFKKESILKVGSYIDIHFLEDYYLWIRSMANGLTFKNIEDCLVHVRTGNGVIHRRSDKRYLLGWKELNKYMKNHSMINSIEYIRNILAVSIFIYSPIFLKNILYKYVLREKV